MAKNIVICFDGTWQTSDSKDQSNVVETAKLVAPVDKYGIEQVVLYDAGVGAGDVTIGRRLDSLLGGAFGHGLLSNIEHAYRFLTFNYAPGDKLYVFGFSRGAFSARSLGGLIRNCGILRKSEVGRVKEAIELYKSRKPEDDPRAAEARTWRDKYGMDGCCVEPDVGSRGSSAPGRKPITIDYMGIWDTVGALGIPKHIILADKVNAKYEFHNGDLSSFVKSGRHAVAIDEARQIFDATLWTNVEALNNEVGDGGKPPRERRYQQQWFPGDHGSVGGGGDYKGISTATLLWILEGAERASLAVNQEEVDRRKLREMAELALSEPVDCMKERPFGVMSLASRKWRVRPAKTAPADFSDISELTRKRFADGKQAYKPKTLEDIKDKLAELVKAMT